MKLPALGYERCDRARVVVVPVQYEWPATCLSRLISQEEQIRSDQIGADQTRSGQVRLGLGWLVGQTNTNGLGVPVTVTACHGAEQGRRCLNECLPAAADVD